MKFKREDFLNALKLVSPALIKSINFYPCVYFKFGFMHAYNNYLGISVKVDNGFDDICIDASLLLKFISKVNSEEIDISLSVDNYMVISSGRMKTKIQIEKVTEKQENFNMVVYGSFILMESRKGNWESISDDFLSCISFCMIPGNDVYGAGVFVFGNEIYDKSNVEMTYAKMKNEMGKFAVDEKYIKEIFKINDLKKYLLTEEFIHFSTEDENSIISFRLLDWNFKKETADEKYLKPFLGKGFFNCILPPDFMLILEKASIFAKDDIVKLSFTRSGISIKSISDYGEFSEYYSWKKDEKPDIEKDFFIYLRIKQLKMGIDRGNLFLNVHERKIENSISYAVSFTDFSNRMDLFSTVIFPEGKGF